MFRIRDRGGKCLMGYILQIVNKSCTGSLDSIFATCVHINTRDCTYAMHYRFKYGNLTLFYLRYESLHTWLSIPCETDCDIVYPVICDGRLCWRFGT